MFGFLKHLLIPHEKNNHRAKLLHNSSLATILSLFLILNFAWYLISALRPDVLGVSYSISESELLELVNKERGQNGRAPLTLNPQLSDAARRKAADMLEKNYWAHFSPDGSTSPWGFIRAAGYNYVHAGENLARGFTDSSAVVTAWMASQSHRDNILADKYRDVGFAIVPGTLNGEETVLIVEMFGSSVSPFIATVSSNEEVKQVSTESAPLSSSPSGTAIENPTKLLAAPKIDSRITSRAISTVGLTFLAFAFITDLVIVERKKIPRIVGHNLDHIILIVGFLLFVILQRSGSIL
ncbi:MAG: hypothetical protein A3C30_05165 [Candidatus Levybacteria bacterium RIFCSPHIGHO2_02_FULL_40_18]|nr:MAG: hypothetical protein A2869_02825 [Candidatus Levybacteria bacterium RIFCSPHIGHO2_01_FULL_40_58]OGH26465.1 MAG: hypothetical protein A3C30_05165 [Candidatus Levybacteria bacterium RIFCSPHIGHO2_02_FULL_40_18]OGH31913.1 MAG: hypothetical protein A3E43_00965 [Candidatus Levybacteria bacterium RIFCSPHIGHO2_12_FULL_40_31]OGH40182.1 MAG: hypothetical protein A2894_05060 [Candidatus Levybacteria bacterium RIFCSPLOWO2_01_FULL_40_64]OGH49306.1 MAG: hypothetical protein A3I54_01510 [Candidatus Lev